MLVPQIVVSKRLRRQLKNGEMPDTIAAMNLFEESKESPRPTRELFRPSPGTSSALSPSPSPSPPLQDDEDHSHQDSYAKQVRFESVKATGEEEKRTSARSGAPGNKKNSSTSSSSSPSSSPPQQSSSSSVSSRKKLKNSSTPKSSSSASRLPSQEVTSADLRQSLVAFAAMSLLILILILGDQEIFTQLYRQLSPPPVNHNLIPTALRFYDSRILSTGIVSPVDGQLTSDSILKWWVDGAFMSPGDNLRRRNITLRVFFNEGEIQFPNGNTFEIEFQGRVEMQVDLAKYGLDCWTVNGTTVSGANEVILEVNFEPLPTDMFYSRTNNGRRLLSATTNTTFYFVSPMMVSKLTPESNSDDSGTHATYASSEFQPLPSAKSPSPAAIGKMKQEAELLTSRLSETVRLDGSNKPIAIPSQHTALKTVHLRSEGGCNDKIGASTLLLTASLSHSLLTSDPSSPSGFGKAIVVFDTEIFAISQLIFDQTSSQPYRVIPAPEGSLSEQSFSLKDVSLRIEGVNRNSMHFVQLFFCKETFLSQTHEECISNPYAWDSSIAMCV